MKGASWVIIIKVEILAAILDLTDPKGLKLFFDTRYEFYDQNYI